MLVRVLRTGSKVDVTLGVETLVGVVAFIYENFASGCLYPPLVGWDIRLQLQILVGVTARPSNRRGCATSPATPRCCASETRTEQCAVLCEAIRTCPQGPPRDSSSWVDVTLGVETLVGVVAFTYENFASGCLCGYAGVCADQVLRGRLAFFLGSWPDAAVLGRAGCSLHEELITVRADHGVAELITVRADHGVAELIPVRADHGVAELIPVRADHGVAELIPVRADHGVAELIPARADHGVGGADSCPC
ncbi:ovochymase-1 [Ixodes scapularis]